MADSTSVSRTTLIRSATSTYCSYVPSSVSPTTFSTTSTNTIDIDFTSVALNILVIVQEERSVINFTCDDYPLCPYPVTSNPDIAGIGVSIHIVPDSICLGWILISQVITAFLITAWTAFAFTSLAYFAGLVPPEFIRRVDTICLRANSRRCQSDWKKTLEKLVLIFSDQQLITGLAIAVAGFIECFKHDLSSHHWRIVVYLIWTSSTVHLISLSLLREWLLGRPFLRNLRVSGMLILAVVLMVSLIPLLNENFLAGNLPVRCFWTHYWHKDYDAFLPTYETPNTIISYVLILIGYTWKFVDAFGTSRVRARKWLVCAPILYLERTIKDRVSPKPVRWSWNWTCSKALTCLYIQLLLVCDILESFMFTLLLLLTTLLWGTLQIVLTRRQYGYRPEERELTFGQLLAVFLLLQPISAIIEHFAKDTGSELHPNQLHGEKFNLVAR